jgi:hypothetical protein
MKSSVFKSTLGIFSGKAHKAPPICKKRAMLMNTMSRPPDEFFLRGSRQSKDFKTLKKQCLSG